MDIEKDLILLNDEINKNANGHLSLNSRVQLMRKINSSNIINKIYATIYFIVPTVLYN